MKKIILFILLLSCKIGFSQVTWQGGANPNQTDPATILFDRTGTPLSTTSPIYAHIGVTLNGSPWQNVIGAWGNNTTQPQLTLVSGNIYKLDLTPTINSFFGVSSGTITKINIVFRNAAGSAQTTDLSLDVGAFQSNLVSPVNGSNTLITSGSNLAISANNTNGNATYNLYANSSLINTQVTAAYSYTDVAITTNKTYQLIVTQGATIFTYNFSVLVNGGTTSMAMAGGLEDGINYNADTSKATLVLTAPGKDFVYVAGSFNNWQPDSSYLMKKDPSTNKFWLELTGLTPGTKYSYQYWVCDQTPNSAAGSPQVVKVADPFSTLVLSPFDDPFIPSASYPNIPSYPSGQQREVTVLETGKTPYAWSTATTNFVKPAKEKLVVYEVLIRDFDANRNFQDLINRIDYFKNLKINAIELMPVMEYEGNESWGYNTSFHMALDKYYGTSEKFKEFVDLCHQNGIAVILDVALNHAFGRNPMVRMWMKDSDGDGWGDPANDNPYFNEFSKHSYNVGSDFNHSSAYTKYYTKRVIKQWIQEYKIDGFRWDLTKGFTQNCTGGDDACTNTYQQDRVDVLKEYTDYSWSLDPTHYTIFEHLGADNEEQQWANYRIGETPSKGVMMWGEMTYPYTQLEEGFTTGADITRMGHVAHGFSAKRLMGYPESHDKDRLVYSGVTYGNSAGSGPVGSNLNNAITRMSSIAAVSLLIPGPKMIWHFQELGMDDSIYTCTNGSVNTESDPTAGDCKLATKPQPQWVENWLTTSPRSVVYNNYAKMIDMKKSNPVFSGDYAISINGNNLKQRIYVYDNSLPASSLKNVVILTNFTVGTQVVTADFPYVGTWVNLMDNSTLAVSSTAMGITIEPGGFRIYGNQPAALGVNSVEAIKNISLIPNPAKDYFNLTESINSVTIYNIAGQLVKQFKGGFETGYNFSVSDLNTGIYFVKASDDDNRQATIKLIKE